MRSHRLEGAATIVALLLSAIAAFRWHAAIPAFDSAPPRIAVAGSIPRTFDEDSLDGAAGDLVERDPFRLSRTPPLVAFAARRAPPIQQAPQFRPALVLKGIIGGPPWQALIDGIPGQTAGTVVRAGSTFDKLTIQSVSRDTVIVQLPDTTVRLTLIKGN